MASIVAREIANVRQFFKSRQGIPGVNASHDVTLQKSFADAIIVMLNATKGMQSTDAAQIMNALVESPYGETQTDRIRSHIDALVQKSCSKPVAASTGKQFLKFWWNFFTASDWEVMRSKATSWLAKQTTLIERGMSVGCVEPNEQCCKWALATLLLMHYDTLPAAKQIYDKVVDFKAAYEAERRPYPHEQVHTFPEDPSALPQQVYDHAYADDNKPVQAALPGINSVANLIPLRKNSKLIKARGSAAESAAAFAEARMKAEIPQPLAPIVRWTVRYAVRSR